MYQRIRLDYEELSPFLTKETIAIHYQIYLDNLKRLNQLLNRVGYDYSYSLRDLVKHIDIFPMNVRGEILYYLSSILNHNLYFYNVSKNQNQKPLNTIAKDIQKYFGSYEEFQKQFREQALFLKGSGYTFLVRDDRGRLKIINTSNEDSPYYYGMVPIICLDLWEHAYFLQYQNHREAYIDNFFQVIDFEKINHYYEQVLQEQNLS